MLKLKKWYVIGKKEFPNPLFYGEDYLLHDVKSIQWQPSETSFVSYKNNITPFPQLVDAGQAINALNQFNIPSFDTRDLAKKWAKSLPHGTWKYLKVTDN